MPRLRVVLCGSMLIAVGVSVVFYYIKVHPNAQYSSQMHKTGDEILKLIDSPPRGVPVNVWVNSVDIVHSGFGTVFYNREHSPYHELVQFDRDLHALLAATSRVDSTTLRAIWLRLEAVDSKGARRINRLRPLFEEMMAGLESYESGE